MGLGNTLMGNASTVARNDYDFADALNQLKGGQMINAGAGTPTAMTSAAPTGTSYSSGAGSFMNTAQSGASGMSDTYISAAGTNATSAGKASQDAYDLLIQSLKNKDK
tara:strand:+ start:204 stop:527 length:324 start_codon:yes stop_codon:yes gene_type:complete